MHMRWSRRQRGEMGPPGPVTLVVVGAAVFASAFGVARAAGTDEAARPAAGPQTQSVALRNATALPSLESAPGPTAAELEAQRERAQEEQAPESPGETTPEAPPTTTTPPPPPGEAFDDSG